MAEDIKYLVIRTRFGKGWNIARPAGEVILMADSREAAWEFIRGNYNDTLDEAPEAYKKKDDIVRLIEPTAKVLFFMYPKMNIKAAEGSPKWMKHA